MNKICKAVIPVAGMATRLYPITKVVSKSMLPIIDKPVLEYLLEELSFTNIKEVIIVIRPEESLIIEYFGYVYKEILINYQIQKKAKGLADAILQCESLVKDEEFLLLLGDDLYDLEDNASLELLNTKRFATDAVVSLVQVEPKDVSSYGICKMVGNKIIEIVEKPKMLDAPSRFAISGRYILPADFFDFLKKYTSLMVNEVLLTDILNDYAINKRLIGVKLLSEHFDVGNRLGYIKTCLNYSLKRDDLKDGLLEYLKKIK